MKVSLNWVKEFTKVDLPVDELVEKIGAQLGAVEEVVNLGERYQGIVIAKVVECKKLEGSDHLNVCRIDDAKHVKDVERGDDGLVQVVCGAPNVREGMLVAWLPPGATVPSSWDGEHFVLEARELRGVVSNGMLASAKELAIGDSHEGLLELDEGQPGDDFAKTFGLDDYIIDIENKMFTHRPDLFGQLGIAREIAGITGQQFTSPDWYAQGPTLQSGEGLPLVVKNEVPQLVPRFMAVAIKNVTVGPSPVWLQTHLSRAGVRPINNIVDVTNYMMLLTGQPLHAYDYDKVKELSGGDDAVIVVRNPHAGEKLRLLNGKEVTPLPQAILIATDKQAIGLGGVMGGSETEVAAATKNIILECASFDMYSIRRTSMALGLFSDAVTRFTKGQSPLQNPAVTAKAVAELVQVAGGEAASAVADDSHVEQADLERGNLYPAVTITAAYINERLGLQLAPEEMKRLLENVEFSVSADTDTLTVQAPFWRTDIELREDVVEEVGRLYGFDKLPLALPRRDLTPAARNPLLEAKSRIRALLAAAGANEVLTYSFVHGNLLQKDGQDPAKAYRVSNALSPDLQYYRLSLMPSLLAGVHPNIKAGHDEFALFELGKVHTTERPVDKDGLPAEDEYTALVVASRTPRAGAAYYSARKYLEQLAGAELAYQPLAADDQTFQVMQPYQPGRCALVSVRATGKFLGIIGEFKPSVAAQLKLPAYTAGFEVDTTVLMELLAAPVAYTPLPRYPRVTQDISLKVPAGLAYQDLSGFLQDELQRLRPENTVCTLSPVDIYQGDDKTAKNITLRLSISSYERTLTDPEVQTLLDKAAAAAQAKFGAERL